MFKKIKVKLNSKIFCFSEVSVWEFWLFNENYELFLEEYFKKYDLDYKKISDENLEKILKNIFDFDEKDAFISEFSQNKKTNLDFHIVVWRFCYILKFSFSEVLAMPLSIFLKMSEDLAYIIWEKDKKDNENFSLKSEKQKLKELFW